MILRRGYCFKLESLCCSFLSLFPKIFVLAALTWALWGTLTELHINSESNFITVTALLATTALYVLSIYTYFKVISVGPGSPLDFPELRLAVTHASEGGMNSSEISEIGEGNEQDNRLLNPRRAPPMEILTSHTIEKGEICLRWCGKCHVWKPDRCHHCSSCKTCFLRMDHHCPWFSCCIGFKNHKFFVQFLLYVFLFCLVVFITSAYLLYLFFLEEQFSSKYLSLTLIFLAVISISFFICVGVFTAFLVYMLLQNLTTIEFQDLRWNYLGDHSAEYVYDSHGKKKKVSNFYDLGAVRNWSAIMGESWYQWVLPITVTSDDLRGHNNGINFEVDEEVFEKYCQNLQLQDRLNEQLQQYGERLRGRRS